MEDVDVEAFGNAPGAPGVGKLRDAFIENTGGAKSERAVDDVGVAGDPADVGHAPVNVFGMDVLVILGSARHIGEVTAGAMLAAFGFAGGAAGVHQEEWIFGLHLDRFNDGVAVILEHIVDEIIAAHDHRDVGSILVLVAAPDENLVNLLALFYGGFHGDV